MLASYCLLCGSFCYVGANYEGQLRLLEPFRAPTGDEAASLIPIEYAINSSAANDVVFIGDSTCRSGLDPLLFERLSGLSAYNLASFGSLGMAGYFLTLNEYLGHHPTPRVVVLCVSPATIPRGVRSDPVANSPTIPVTTAGALYERFLRVYGPPDQRRSVFADGTTSLRYFINRGMSISKCLCTAHPFGQGPDQLDEPIYGFATESYRSLREKTFRRRGFFPLPEEHGAAVISLPAFDEPESVLPWMDDGVREFASLARSHGFRLLIRLSPISSSQAPWKSECLSGWLKQLESEFPELSAGRPEILWYDPAICWDCVHLNTRGAAQFTTKTAQDVAAILPSTKVSQAGGPTGKIRPIP